MGATSVVAVASFGSGTAAGDGSGTALNSCIPVNNRKVSSPTRRASVAAAPWVS